MKKKKETQSKRWPSLFLRKKGHTQRILYSSVLVHEPVPNNCELSLTPFSWSSRQRHDSGRRPSKSDANSSWNQSKSRGEQSRQSTDITIFAPSRICEDIEQKKDLVLSKLCCRHVGSRIIGHFDCLFERRRKRFFSFGVLTSETKQEKRP